MAISSFLAKLNENHRRGDIVMHLLYINVGMFILTALTGIVLILFRLPPVPWLNWLELPAWIEAFIRQPWSLLTYMFMHAGVFHLLFNMLCQYWFGRLIQNFFSARQKQGLYILGG